MQGTLAFAELIYCLSGMIVAAYNDVTDTYSTPVAVTFGNQLIVEPEADTDKLRGYGAIAATLAIPIGAKLTFGAGSVDKDVMVVVAGYNFYNSGVTPNQVYTEDLRSGGDGDLPRFGVIASGLSTAGGLLVLGLNSCQLDAPPKFSLDGKENKFNMSEVGGYAVSVLRSTKQQLWRRKFYETASDFTVPNSGANFKAFFTAPDPLALA